MTPDQPVWDGETARANSVLMSTASSCDPGFGTCVRSWTTAFTSSMADWTASVWALDLITGKATSSAQASGPFRPLNSASGNTFGAYPRSVAASCTRSGQVGWAGCSLSITS